jgi:hypothetical protein
MSLSERQAQRPLERQARLKVDARVHAVVDQHAGVERGGAAGEEPELPEGAARDVRGGEGGDDLEPVRERPAQEGDLPGGDCLAPGLLEELRARPADGVGRRGESTITLAAQGRTQTMAPSASNRTSR